MPSYAILGGTGSTGSQIIRQLLDRSPSPKLQIYARSKPRLLSTLPGIDSNPNVSIHIGNLSDTEVIKSCITGVNAIFLTAATNNSEPGVSVARDSASAVLNALRVLKKEFEIDDKPWKCPTLILLSSASVSPEHSKNTPKLGLWFIHQAVGYVYQDLQLATEMLRAEESWVPLIVICPGAISESKPTGFDLTLKAAEIGMVSYEDLAGGMILAAEESGRWEGKKVGIAPRKMVEDPKILPLVKNIVRGLMARWVPPLYHFMRWLRVYA